jgi:GrpB-like predicted nucleotidyltransferase (UPF0157 family)
MAPIEIVPYRPGWPSEFTRIGATLRSCLGKWALAIHHIGSTAVPGLAAKDVIDLQVTVTNLDIDQPVRDAFDEAGFPLRPGDPARDHVPRGAADRPGDWAKAMAGHRPGQRRVHIHIRAVGRPNQRYPLLFRDYLRSAPSASDTYSLIKTELAARHRDDVDAYYAVKDPVCDLIISAAEGWAQRVAWSIPATDA